MDASVECRYHGPHLPKAVERELAEDIQDIEAAVRDFQTAAVAFERESDSENAERVWTSSRYAWSLLLPSRREVLRTHRAMIERFRDSVERLRQRLERGVAVPNDLVEDLTNDLAYRQSLLDAVLAVNGEQRVRELLTARR